MSTTVVSTKQARDSFSDLLGRVYYRDEVITIEKKGKLYAVLISPEARIASPKILLLRGCLPHE
jgi:prevent-host-death family protein